MSRRAQVALMAGLPLLLGVLGGGYQARGQLLPTTTTTPVATTAPGATAAPVPTTVAGPPTTIPTITVATAPAPPGTASRPRTSTTSSTEPSVTTSSVPVTTTVAPPPVTTTPPLETATTNPPIDLAAAEKAHYPWLPLLVTLAGFFGAGAILAYPALSERARRPRPPLRPRRPGPPAAGGPFDQDLQATPGTAQRGARGGG